MNLAVTVEHRFERTPDGRVWTWGPYPYGFWQTHLAVFDAVRVVARVRDVASRPRGSHAASGEHVSFVGLPHYIGPAQYLWRAPEIRRVLRHLAGEVEAALLRAPSLVASCFHRSLASGCHPYGVEVLGDPLDVFERGAVDHPLRYYFRWRFARDLRAQCAGACAVAYVTREALQKRYPAGSQAVSVPCSDVQLPSSAFRREGARRPRHEGAARIVTVASLEQPYKGVDVLIDAVDQVRLQGIPLELTVVGDGRYRKGLEAQAERRNLRVRFTGRLNTEGVREQLDRADLFVLPSRCEGLPKALLEAMARGLPCIATAVGGIPEVLDEEALVPRGDVFALAAKILAAAGSEEMMWRMARRNSSVAEEYRESLLREKQLAFYVALKEATHRQLSQTGGCLARAAGAH